jgi:predicted ATPase
MTISLTAITLENFKSIEGPVRIELAPLTLLFGPNNAGKSTIIHALMYARELLANNNADPRGTVMGGKTADLGGFHAMVHGNDRSRHIRIRLEFRGAAWDAPK